LRSVTAGATGPERRRSLERISQLWLENLESWADRSFRLAPVTGLFGADSSGKSSLLQFLQLLRQTADAADRTQVLHFGDERTPVELGEFLEVVSGHDTARSIEWQLEWGLRAPLRVADPAAEGSTLFEGDSVRFSGRVGFRANGDEGRPLVQRLAYGFGGHEFATEPSGLDAAPWCRFRVHAQPGADACRRAGRHRAAVARVRSARGPRPDAGACR